MVKIDPDRLRMGEAQVIKMTAPSDKILLARSEDGLVIFPIVERQEG